MPNLIINEVINSLKRKGVKFDTFRGTFNTDGAKNLGIKSLGKIDFLLGKKWLRA